MAGFDGTFSSTPSAFSPSEPPAPHPIALRPLSTGEALDRIFFLYRSNFRLFALLGGLPAIAGIVNGAIQLPYTTAVIGSAMHGQKVSQPVGQSISSIVGSIVIIFCMVLTEAGCADAVAHLYRGESITAANALRSSLKHWWRYSLVYFWKLWSFVWLPGILIGAGGGLVAISARGSFSTAKIFGGVLIFLGVLATIYGLIAYIRNSLSLPAAIVENLKVRPAMRRSKNLVADRKVRIFLFLLMLVVLYFCVGLVSSPLTLYAIRVHGLARVLCLSGATLVQGIITTLMAPIIGIGLAVFYFDERVRREAFDVELLMQQASAGSEPAPAQ